MFFPVLLLCVDMARGLTCSGFACYFCSVWGLDKWNGSAYVHVRFKIMYRAIFLLIFYSGNIMAEKVEVIDVETGRVSRSI